MKISKQSLIWGLVIALAPAITAVDPAVATTTKTIAQTYTLFNYGAFRGSGSSSTDAAEDAYQKGFRHMQEWCTDQHGGTLLVTQRNDELPGVGPFKDGHYEVWVQLHVRCDNASVPGNPF
jgi:hypothetical protein